MELAGQLQVTSWQEDELRNLGEAGGKVTRASIGYRVTGDVDGQAVHDLVMYYRPDGTAHVVGLWQVTGSVGGRPGGVLFESGGGYDGTTATSSLNAIPGSGTGGFAGAHGAGRTSATSEDAEYALDLDF